MRKKPSIYWTLFHLWKVWRKYPQLRLGQLIINAMRELPDHDLFNLRDETVVGLLDTFDEQVSRMK